jgi:hypothetical protein
MKIYDIISDKVKNFNNKYLSFLDPIGIKENYQYNAYIDQTK